MKRHRRPKSPPFVMLPWRLIDSPAWKELSNGSRVALIHLMRQVRSANPGEITLLHRHMAEIMKRETYARAIRQLEEMGFVDRIQIGGLYRKKNIFKLSDRWKEYHTRPENGSYIGPENGSCQETKKG